MTESFERHATVDWWNGLFQRGRLLVTGPDGRIALPIGNKGAAAEGVKVSLEATRAFGGVRFVVDVTADHLAELHDFHLDYMFAPSPTDFIVCNGFQSWTETARYRADQSMPPMNAGVRHAMGPLGDDTFLPYTGTPGELRSWTYTVVRPADDATPLFLGSMDETTAYTAFEFRTREGRLRLWRDVAGWTLQPNETVRVLDLWVRFGPEDACLSTWTRERGHSARAEHVRPAVAGWTSWYHHYTNIDEGIILDNVEEMAAARIPLDVFQIDDGWQIDIGTWTPNAKFPRGMAALADDIHARGYDAGLWLAPFIAEETSTILRDHPEWVLTDASGERVHAGYNPLWSGFYWALDAEREDVRQYAFDSVRDALHEWGFDLVKLDFLFAAGLRARPGRTRAAQMTDALDLLREAAGPEKRILGCGVPLGPAFKRVDYCRIGPDVSLGWDDPFTKMLEHRERPSTEMTIKNTLVRAGLSGRGFLCDPDVFLLRSENTSLTVEERHTLALCNLIAGDVAFTSDDLSTYSADQFRLLYAHFPPRRTYGFDLEEGDDRMVASFTVGGAAYRLFVNFQDVDATVTIDDDVVLENDLPPDGRRSFGIRMRERGDRIDVPAHGARVVAVLPPPLRTEESPRVLGTDGHLLPGAEVVGLSSEASDRAFEISVSVHEKARGAHRCWVEVPPDIDVVTVGGKAATPRTMGRYRVVDVRLKPPRWRPPSKAR